MNPLFTITANATTRKITATTGIVAVGEKVDVQISGLTESDIPWIDDNDHTKGRSLRFRIVDTNGRDVARFPLAATDVWTVSSNVFTATVNLDTDVLRCAFCGAAYNAKMDFGIILDSYVDSMEYARGRLYIQQWAQCPTEDPTVMPDWLSTLAQLKADIATVDASKTAAAASATAAAASATLAGTKVTLAETYATAADTARGAAVNAKNAAESARDAASGYADDAEDYKDAAAVSASAAAGSATAAATSASHYPYVDANGHWKVWEDGAWVDKGAAKGDKGDTGSQGPQGAAGQNGADGATGPANTLTIGSVTKGDEPSATITGTAPNQVLNLTLPKGDKGNTGAQGQQGVKGDTGSRGVQGPQGEKGDKGDKGDPGDVSQILTGETMSANPTQRQIATALKSIWLKLGGTVAIVMLSLAALCDVTRDTEWQDVPPETKIGTVVDLGQGGGGGGGVSPSVVTGIVASAAVTNAGAVAEAKADAAAKYMPTTGGTMTGNIRFIQNKGIDFYDYNGNNLRASISFPSFLGFLTYTYTSPDGRSYTSAFPTRKSGTFAMLDDIPTKFSWSNVTNTPTTLSGYGIVDAYTKTEANAKFLYKNGTAADAKELRHYNGGMVTGVPKIYYDEDENSWAVTDGNQQTLMPAGGSSYAKMADIPDAYTRAASDARYAPTSTAVTVASHASQLSQLSQSIDYSTNNTQLVSTITNLAPSKASGVSLRDPVRNCSWYAAVTNGVFYWEVED